MEFLVKRWRSQDNPPILFGGSSQTQHRIQQHQHQHQYTEQPHQQRPPHQLAFPPSSSPQYPTGCQEFLSFSPSCFYQQQQQQQYHHHHHQQQLHGYHQSDRAAVLNSPGAVSAQSPGTAPGHSVPAGLQATGSPGYRPTDWSGQSHDSSLALTGSLLDSALRTTGCYAEQPMENIPVSGSGRHPSLTNSSVLPMDVSMTGANGASDMAGATCSASVPIPGRGPDWPGAGVVPDYMRDPLWRHSVDELGTSAGGEYCSGFASPAPMGGALKSPPLPATPLNSYQLPLSASQEPELSRNLQLIQIEDIFDGVDVCDLLPEPTLSELNAETDESAGVGDALTLSRSLGLEQDPLAPGIHPLRGPEMVLGIKSELDLTDTPVDWLAEGGSVGAVMSGGDASAVSAELSPLTSHSISSSSFPRISPLVGNHDPLLAGWRSPGPVPALRQHSVGGPSTLQTLLSRPPLSPSPAARPPGPLAAPGGAVGAVVTRLSSSVPADTTLAAAGVRLTPLSAAARVEEARGSGSSISTAGILSPASIDSYMGDGIDSHDESFSDSDAGSLAGDDETSPLPRKDKYFWQYNVQSKGPKGHRLQLTPDLTDPLNIHEVVDPVFSSEFQTKGIKHSGKARRGDGNDLTPSPRKLLAIRRDLYKLNQLINDLTPPSELPFNVRPRSRKEKNKLASRACRLKKKAQHEAYKIQLAGLKDEHKRLSAGLSGMCELLKARLNSSDTPMTPAEETTAKLERIVRAANKSRVAGQLPEFVQRVLDKIESQSLSFAPLGVAAGNLQPAEDCAMSSELG